MFLKLKVSRGFTLIEIVLALGIISFAMVGIFGLLSAAATSSSNSDRDTVLASMSTQVLNDLRSSRFDNLWLEDADRRKAEITTALPLKQGSDTGLPDSNYYFTADGRLIADYKLTTDTVYECIVLKTADIATQGYADSKDGKVINNVVNLKMMFTWPANVPKENRQRLVNYAKVARY